MTAPILVGGRRPATIAEAEWETAAERLQFDALAGVRGSAEKWVAALGTILGIFTVAELVKGPSDVSKVDVSWAIVVAAATIGGIACAAWATYLASKAAYGLPADIRAVGGELRRYQREEAARAANYLRSAIRYALRALLLVGLAVMVLWFVTPRDPSTLASVLVVTADDGIVCGTLQAAEDEASVSVKPEKKSARTIASDEIVSITAVSKCP